MTTRAFNFYTTLWLIISISGLDGCSTTQQPPNNILANAEMAINQAKTQAAQDLAAVELRTAQDKLQQAKAALQQEDYDQATQLAEQALVDAQLAEARAATGRARQAVKQLRQTSEEAE